MKDDKMKWYEQLVFSVAVFAVCGLLFIFGVCRAVYEVGYFYLTGKEA